jgi:peptidyl-prolyl cis-trans isomerase SurA
MRILFIFFSLLIGAEALYADDTNSSRIAAIVNKNIISQADLQNRAKLAAISSGLESTEENLEKIKPQILRMMIDEKLQLEVEQKYKFQVSPQQIKNAIKGLEEGNGMPEGAVTQLLEDNHIPMKTLEDQIKANLMWVTFIREKYSQTVQIADWEIDQEVKAQEDRENKTQYHLAEILIPFDGAEQEERAKNDLIRLSEELQKGVSFPALAQQFSGSATAAQGGDMGWLTEDDIGIEIKDALASLTPGQLSQPIRTPQGYTLIAYIDKQLPGAEGRTYITLQQAILPFPQDVDEEKARAIMEMALSISKSAKSCADVEKLAKAKHPAAQAVTSQKKQMSSLPAEVQKIVEPLAVNESTGPILTQDGALLLMICSKETIEPKKFTKDDAKELLTERKLGLLAKRELRDLKRHAFIEMRM